jgi:hypothetical protein
MLSIVPLACEEYEAINNSSSLYFLIAATVALQPRNSPSQAKRSADQAGKQEGYRYRDQ